jgi:hypothetical protein
MTESSPEVEGLEVGHFTDGPHDGLARFENSVRAGAPIVIALGPVAATKLGAALLAASFDHRAASGCGNG